MSAMVSVSQLTSSEKIELMEELWADLSRKNGDYSPPAWHGEILAERKKLAESGEVGFTEWEKAKQEIRDRVS